MLLRAEFVRKAGRFVSCRISGHAEYSDDDAAGLTLCTAVSSAMQLTCNTLTECFGVPESAVTVKAHRGVQNELSIRLAEPDHTQSEILHGLLIHLEVLEEQFSDRIRIRVTDEA